jgi:hypothetical protein
VVRNCCTADGPCAMHLAEQRDDERRTASKVHCGNSVAFVPNYDQQELVGAFARARMELG